MVTVVQAVRSWMVRRVRVMISPFCRALPLVYEKDTEVLGIPTYRFRVPPTAFDYDENVSWESDLRN